MTFDELIANAQLECDQARKRQQRALATVKMIHEQAQKEARASLTPEEDADVKSAMEVRDGATADLTGATDKLAQLKRAKAASEEEFAALEMTGKVQLPDSKPAHDRVVRVGREERTYNPDNDRKGALFARDVIRRAMYGDLEAEQRLTRHMIEERVERGAYLTRAAGDTTTTNWAGLTVPAYLTELYAPATAALRPFADICNRHDLPPGGMSVNISQVTTASSAALQASQLTAVSATSLDDTLLTVNVQTAAGQQTISRQAIDRGTGIEEIVMNDLFRRYATTLDATLITQASTGLSAVAQAVTYTDATPTAAELWPKVHNALANSEAALLGQARPNYAVMHSRRWYWMQSQVGTSWPFFAQPAIPTQAGGTNAATIYNGGARGMLPNGLVAIVDNNIGTALGAGTEDEIYVVASDECHLWEDPSAPVFIRAEQTAAASLGVLLVLYGYFAYAFNRYANGQSKIGGTGLIAPTF